MIRARTALKLLLGVLAAALLGGAAVAGVVYHRLHKALSFETSVARAAKAIARHEQEFRDDQAYVAGLPLFAPRTGTRDAGPLERAFAAGALAAWASQLTPVHVDVSLPRWRSSTSAELSAVLHALGIVKAFAPGAADLSGIDGTRELYLSAVIHQAAVEVGERGTEAVAATAPSVVGAAPGVQEASRDLPRRPPVPLRHPRHGHWRGAVHGPALEPRGGLTEARGRRLRTRERTRTRPSRGRVPCLMSRATCPATSRGVARLHPPLTLSLSKGGRRRSWRYVVPLSRARDRFAMAASLRGGPGLVQPW
jgi:hypothetical protein